MNRTLIVAAAASGISAVALGAWSAHGLPPHFPHQQRELFDTASRYHFYHTLALLFLALNTSDTLSRLAGWAFLAGIFLFSGSLYVIAIQDLWGVAHLNFIRPLTPVGGILLMMGWALAGVAAAIQVKKT